LDKLSNKYIDLIVEWNGKFNLTGLKNADDIRTKLYEDSLNITSTINLDQPIKMIDIGCGAGFPGIPLKIEHPQLKLTLVDSIGKKIAFVKHVISELKLNDTEALNARAEELAKRVQYREQYDIAISRAVASLNVLAEYCLPFVKVGGLFIAPKGTEIDTEIRSAEKAVKVLGGKLKDKIKVGSGYVLIYEKIKPTPNSFPRETGIPSKSPM
jgi:16S rRNA (guanine527-N7)-methyltransferase